MVETSAGSPELHLTGQEIFGIALGACLLMFGLYRGLHLYTSRGNQEGAITSPADLTPARAALTHALAGDTIGLATLAVDSAPRAWLNSAARTDSATLATWLRGAPQAWTVRFGDTTIVHWYTVASARKCVWRNEIVVTFVGAPDAGRIARIAAPCITDPAALPDDSGSGAHALSTADREWNGLSAEAAAQTIQTITGAFESRGAKPLVCPASRSSLQTGPMIRGSWQYQDYAVRLTEVSAPGSDHALRLSIKATGDLQVRLGRSWPSLNQRPHQQH